MTNQQIDEISLLVHLGKITFHLNFQVRDFVLVLGFVDGLI